MRRESGTNRQGHSSLIGGPVSTGWREGTLTRAWEIEALSKWACDPGSRSVENTRKPEALLHSIEQHVAAAREAAKCKSVLRSPRSPSLLERARSNLDAAEAQLIDIAPPEFVLGQMPGLLNHVQRHLPASDPRRTQFEHIAERLGFKDPDVRTHHQALPPTRDDKKREVERHRGLIASIVRGASSAALREQLRVRSFRNVVVGAIIVTASLALALGAIGWRSPEIIPLCFQPERDGQTMVVCPTQQSPLKAAAPGAVSQEPDVDVVVKETASSQDLLLVEFLGLSAAAVAAAAAIRGIRGSSERYGLPVALTILKLPIGALTAVLGILLMRGQFVPGLSALDTSAQILAWALIFGYGQQLFTRLVDQQAHTVLDSVRGGRESMPRAEDKASV